MTEDAAKTDLPDILKILKNAFKKAPFPDIKTRQQDLKTLKALLLDNQDAFIQAMDQDFGNRSSDESKIGDILSTVQGINYSLDHLKKWMKPSKRHLSLLLQPASARVEYQPLGPLLLQLPAAISLVALFPAQPFPALSFCNNLHQVGMARIEFI